MTKKHKLSVFCVLLLIAFTCVLNYTLAPKITNSYDKYYTKVQNHLNLIIKEYDGQNIFEADIHPGLSLGAPYIIYRYDSESQTKCYYYPVIDENNIIFVLETIIVNGEPVINITDNLVKALNALEAIDNEILVYYYNNNVYLETREHYIDTRIFYGKGLMDESPEKWNASFDEKKVEIEQAENNMVEIDSSEKFDEEQLKHTKMYGNLSLSNFIRWFCWTFCDIIWLR